jgi:parallel beta-helix repeat protein
MKRRCTVFVAVFVVSMLIGIQAVEVVDANPTHLAPALSKIIIAKDGSVQPSTELIKQNGSTYFLTKNIVGKYCILVSCNNIVFDGQGNSIDSGETKTSFGIHITTYQSNVTVKNVIINRFYTGIFFEGNNNCKIDNVTISNSAGGNLMDMKSDGINLLTSCCYNNITNCQITNCDGAGIVLSSASNSNLISGNTIVASQKAIVLTDSGNNIFFENDFSNSSVAVYLLRNNPNLSVRPLTPRNIFYLNNFINNSQQVDFKQYSGTITDDESVSNSWDNGSIGNYWSDNNNSNPYILNDVNLDHYPLNKQITFELSPIQNPASTIIPSPTSNQTQFSETLNPTYLIAIAVVIVIVAVASVLLVYFRRRKGKP